jgi:hypothetical protein
MTRTASLCARPHHLTPRAAIALAACGLACAAQAATTTLTFGGQIETVDSALATGFQAGDAITIALRYDPATPDLMAPSPSQAGYAYLAFDLRFGGYAASFGTQYPNSIGVLNNVDQGLGLADAFGASAFETGAGPAVAGLPLQQGFFTLWDFLQTAFANTALPVAPSFDAFSYRVAGLTFCSNTGCGVGSNMSTVYARITSMAVTTAVPEPATAALVLAGMLVLAAAAVRRCRHEPQGRAGEQHRARACLPPLWPAPAVSLSL